RQHHNGASKAYSPRAPCKVAQKIERSRKLPDAGKVVLDYEHAVVAKILSIEHVIDVIAVAPAVSGRPIARGLGSAEQSKLHGITLLAKNLTSTVSSAVWGVLATQSHRRGQIDQLWAISQASLLNPRQECARAIDEGERLLQDRGVAGGRQPFEFCALDVLIE